MVHPRGDPRRGEVEAFIREVYARHFGAHVQQFAPVLVSTRDHSGILAAAGYRHAAEGPLFLERYLAEPVQALLASHPEAPQTRRGIVEVGHLSAVKAGEGRSLILRLGPHLAEQGFDWVVTTVTEELRHLFVRIGLTPITLGVAEAAALGEDARYWGSYYDHRPVVVTGRLQQALRQLARRAAPAGGRA